MRLAEINRRTNYSIQLMRNWVTFSFGDIVALAVEDPTCTCFRNQPPWTRFNKERFQIRNCITSDSKHFTAGLLIRGIDFQEPYICTLCSLSLVPQWPTKIIVSNLCGIVYDLISRPIFLLQDSTIWVGISIKKWYWVALLRSPKIQQDVVLRLDYYEWHLESFDAGAIEMNDLDVLQLPRPREWQIRVTRGKYILTKNETTNTSILFTTSLAGLQIIHGVEQQARSVDAECKILFYRNWRIDHLATWKGHGENWPTTRTERRIWSQSLLWKWSVCLSRISQIVVREEV